jgi:hypothetical protein
MYAAGFVGAIDFFRKKLIPYCNVKNSFAKATFQEVLLLNEGNLIQQEEVKGIGGRDAPKTIFDRLNGVFQPVLQNTQPIQF